ncbi:glycosyltransferase [Amylolactobacillus amylophilus]|uniref:glycosyltransferase n=1 Tax=Amylolactobacillus amylophilus TaxID=1603 RepID=UPI0006D27C3C
MSCGCALVSTKNGGVEDFGVDNYSALLCDVNNTKDISKKIISLLNDSSFRVKIANNGLEMVKSMNFFWIVLNFLKMYFTKLIIVISLVFLIYFF